ncbi:sulfite exporter TauE/SafE family protein [Methylocella silvestris]|nr:sulfite exporter TauE/SafE family protein [Methylocella silvestris]
MTTLSVIWVGAFIGALAAGGAGFAFAFVASSIWLHVLDPVRTTALIVACGSLLHITLVWPIRRSIESARLSPFLAGGIFGVPLGVWLLTRFDPTCLKGALGLLMIAYGFSMALKLRLSPVFGDSRRADVAIGFVSGALGGVAGYSGVLTTIWTQLRGWPKDVARGVYQPFILFSHLLTLTLVGVLSIDRGGIVLFALALPPLVAGAWLGFEIYGRLNEVWFGRVLSLMLIGSGAILFV